MTHPARQLWHLIEPIHAVTYFHDACRAANREVGLRGFWMGYFGSRAAPLGPVGPEVVLATFFGFHPSLVRRAIPDAWSFATPKEVLEARRQSAAGALRQVFPDIGSTAGEAAEGLRPIVEAAGTAGRPLFAANRALPASEDPVERLWQHTTTLREHRGDGHVACLTAEGLDGPEAHILASAARGSRGHGVREARGWTEEEWADAADRLAERDLVSDGELTDEGQRLKDHIERRTDELAGSPLSALSGDELEQVQRLLASIADAVRESGILSR